MTDIHPEDQAIHEEVARIGRAFAEVKIFKSDEGRFFVGYGFQYCHGGCACPVSHDNDGHDTEAAARETGIRKILKDLHKPFPSDSHQVHHELQILREQLEAQLKQPSLF